MHFTVPHQTALRARVLLLSLGVVVNAQIRIATSTMASSDSSYPGLSFFLLKDSP